MKPVVSLSALAIRWGMEEIEGDNGKRSLQQADARESQFFQARVYWLHVNPACSHLGVSSDTAAHAVVMEYYRYSLSVSKNLLQHAIWMIVIVMLCYQPCTNTIFRFSDR